MRAVTSCSSPTSRQAGVCDLIRGGNHGGSVRRSRRRALQVTSAVVVIVVDLSDPAAAVPSAAAWLARISSKLAATYALFQAKGLTLPEQLRARQRSKLWGGHADRDLIAHSGGCGGASASVSASAASCGTGSRAVTAARTQVGVAAPCGCP